ncbi:unnamed protein product [Ambrosiozyma monospora]|uniref:Unnamed protein product n=1 Tax=Ambrosiozyma monospora TaxID=43982 RepID=A0ACB5U2U9_AMBMO|nr:unnamed protein product [Ambrosiozyma monospora]
MTSITKIQQNPAKESRDLVNQAANETMNDFATIVKCAEKDKPVMFIEGDSTPTTELAGNMRELLSCTPTLERLLHGSPFDNVVDYANFLLDKLGNGFISHLVEENPIHIVGFSVENWVLFGEDQFDKVGFF